MSKKSNKETIQILILVSLLFGLLISLGVLVYLSFPDKIENNRQPESYEELSSNDDSTVKKGPLVLKLTGTFSKIPRSNSTLNFNTSEGQVQLKIPSDFPSNFKMNSIHATVHYVGMKDNNRVFQLLEYSSTGGGLSDVWTSRIKPKQRIRSSSWYYF